jgi:nucleoside-diphosphate-sugar epimerase
MITIDELVDIVSSIAGKKITKRYDLTKPQGVRGRNSDNTKLYQVLKWQPEVPLERGLEITYKWIRNQLAKNGKIKDYAVIYKKSKAKEMECL